MKTDFLSDEETGMMGLHMSEKWVNVYSAILGVRFRLRVHKYVENAGKAKGNRIPSVTYSNLVSGANGDSELDVSMTASPSFEKLPSMGEWERFTHEFGHMYFGSFSKCIRNLHRIGRSYNFRKHMQYSLNVLEDARLDSFFSKEWKIYFEKRVESSKESISDMYKTGNKQDIVFSTPSIRAVAIIYETMKSYTGLEHGIDFGLPASEMRKIAKIVPRIIPFIGVQISDGGFKHPVMMKDVVTEEIHSDSDDEFDRYVELARDINKFLFSGVDVANAEKQSKQSQQKKNENEEEEDGDESQSSGVGEADEKDDENQEDDKKDEESSSSSDEEETANEGDSPDSASGESVQKKMKVQIVDNSVISGDCDALGTDLSGLSASKMGWKEARELMAMENTPPLVILQKLLEEYKKSNAKKRTDIGKFSVRGYMRDKFRGNYSTTFINKVGRGGLDSSKWLFLIDMSSSMIGEKFSFEINFIETVHKFLPQSAAMKFIIFNDEFDMLPMNREMGVKELVDRIRPYGGTTWKDELVNVLDEYTSAGWQLVILTDGMITAEPATFDRIMKSKESVPLVVLIGNSADFSNHQQFKMYVSGKDYVTDEMFKNKEYDTLRRYFKKVLQRYS